MAKAKKPAPKKAEKKDEEKPVQKKKGSNDINVIAPEGMSFEDIVKMAVNTPPPKNKK